MPPSAHPSRPLAPALTPPSSACHCEERGSRPATWQSASPAQGVHCGNVLTNVATPPAFCMSLRASAHTGVAIRSPAAVQNEKQYFWQIRGSLRIRPKCYFFLPFSAGRGLRTSDRCHWFAMTCGNLPGVRTVPAHCWAKTCRVSAQYHRLAWPPIGRIFPRLSPTGCVGAFCCPSQPEQAKNW